MTLMPSSLGAGLASRLPPALWLVAALKIALLLIYRPIYCPDTIGYEQFADRILADWSWFTGARFNEAPLDMTVMRMAGYPLLIAGAKLLFGAGWRFALALGQFGLSLAASLAFLRLCLALAGSARVAHLALAAQVLGFGLVIDQALLTDSLFGNLMILLVCRLSLDSLEGRAPTLRAAAGLGLMIAAMFLLRESTQYLLVFFPPLFYLWLRGRGRRMLLLGGLALTAPFLLTLVSYQLWNVARTGYGFVTTGGQTAYTYALAQVLKDGVPVFEGEAPADRVGREVFHEYSFDEVVDFNKALFARYGLNPVEIARAAAKSYGEVWRRHPLAMALALRKSIKEDHHIFLPFRPDESLSVLPFWAGGERLWPKGVAVLQAFKADHDPWWLPLFAAQVACRVISTLLFLLFLAGPLLALRGPRRPVDWLMLSWALLYAGFLGTYTLIHMDLRYLVPVLPFVIAGAIPVAMERLPRLWCRLRQVGNGDGPDDK